jgi:hypothetical protein
MLRCRSGYKSSWESGFTRLNEATFRGNHNDHQRWPLAKQDLTSIMYNTFACICADFVSWLKVTSHVLKSSYTWADSLQGHSKVAFNSWNSLWTWIPGCIGSTTPKTNFQDWVLRISGELQPAKPRFIAYTLSSRLISWMLFTFASYLSWPEAFCSGNAWVGFLATVKTLYWFLGVE